MAVTASMVKELREMTGAGMMDCKKALSETDGQHGRGYRISEKERPGEGREEGWTYRGRRYRNGGSQRRQDRSDRRSKL